MNYALRFRFKASNNEAEYEALILGLKLAKEMKVESIDIFIDLCAKSTKSTKPEKRKWPPTSLKPKKY